MRTPASDARKSAHAATKRRSASILGGEAVSGTTMVAAGRQTRCGIGDPETVVAGRRGNDAASAPRTLKAPVGCNVSSFAITAALAPGRLSHTSGVVAR
jgi:hypothetical protein